MNIFKLNVNDHIHYKIETDSFDHLTQRKYPWHQGGQQYGVCPVCLNPIQMVNLYPTKETNISAYGKHCDKSIPDIAVINGVGLEECPLYYKGSGSYHPDEKRPLTNQLCQAIIKLFLEQFPHIFSVCQKATGINFSLKIANSMLEHYCTNEGYLFRNAYTFNIPWIFLYRTQNINLFGQFINNKELLDAIQALNLPCLELSSNNQLLGKDFFIEIYFTDYKMLKTIGGYGIIESITLNATNNRNHFFKQTITFDYDSYNQRLNTPWFKEVKRNQDLNDLANKIFCNLIY